MEVFKQSDTVLAYGKNGQILFKGFYMCLSLTFGHLVTTSNKTKLYYQAYPLIGTRLVLFEKFIESRWKI